MLQVKSAIYLAYIQAIGFAVTIIFLLIYIFSSTLGVLSNLWLADWSDNAKRVNVTAGENDTNTRLGIYALLGLGQGKVKALGVIKLGPGLYQVNLGLYRVRLHFKRTEVD